MTEREMVVEMARDLEKARETLRQQLSGVENQLFILMRLGERMDTAVRETGPEPKLDTESKPEPLDPLEALGLSSGTASEPGSGDGRVQLTYEEVARLIGREG